MRFSTIESSLDCGSVDAARSPLSSFPASTRKTRHRTLWEKVVTVKRVAKPNRKASQPLPKTQKTYLLTLQWRVLKRGNGNVQTEGNPNQVFQTGDQLKLAVTTNQDGYLYVIHRMNNGNGKLVFPDPRSNKGLNKVKKNQEYVV